jgi:hypothetical protein
VPAACREQVAERDAVTPTPVDQQPLRERSGKVDGDDLLQAFLYRLMRDEVVPGAIEGILLDVTKETEFQYTNGYLAQYAKDVADRLR